MEVSQIFEKENEERKSNKQINKQTRKARYLVITKKENAKQTPNLYLRFEFSGKFKMSQVYIF